MAEGADEQELRRGRGTPYRLLPGQEVEMSLLMERTEKWLNATAFVREAVNEKLAREWLSAGRIEAELRADEALDAPRNVQDVARRSGRLK